MLADDPDVQVFRVDFRTAMDNCYCRCECPMDIVSPAADSDSTFQEAFCEASMELDSAPPALEQVRPLPGWLSDHSPSSNNMPIDHVSLSDEQIPQGPDDAQPSNGLAEHRESVRERFGLPELRFSDNLDFTTARHEEVDMAFEDADTATAFESFEEAHNYMRAAAYFASLAHASADHPLYQLIRDRLADYAERVEHEAEAEQTRQQEREDIL